MVDGARLDEDQQEGLRQAELTSRLLQGANARYTWPGA